MCGGRSSILHYGPLIVTNYLYAPTPNGQSLSAWLNKSNNPPPPHTHTHTVSRVLTYMCYYQDTMLQVIVSYVPGKKKHFVMKKIT